MNVWIQEEIKPISAQGGGAEGGWGVHFHGPGMNGGTLKGEW